MNIAMEQTEEYVNGQLKNKYGDAFIRGNNGNFYIPRLLIYTLKEENMHNEGSNRLIFSFFFFYHNFHESLFNAVLYISTSKRTLGDGA